jgi:hypothetical protein
MDTAPFYLLLFIHLASLILGFGSVLVTDLYGLLWIWDRLRFREVVRMSGVNARFIWIGWSGMVLSGVPLILLKGEIDQLMIVKLFFVALIGLNGIPLHFLQKKMEELGRGAAVPGVFMFRLTLSLLVSQLGWWGAMTIGFLHRHVWSVIEWPDRPWLVPTLIVVGFLLVWGGGEAFFRWRSGASTPGDGSIPGRKPS